MKCTGPVRITKNLNPAEYPDGLEVPCGKCLACRIKKRSEWSLRMTLEKFSWGDSMFLTLTYDDENLPKNASLEKKELQKFFKRLRKELEPKNIFQELENFIKYDTFNHPIKYFACGEYGKPSRVISNGFRTWRTVGNRPHYHAIIYGLGLTEDEKSIIKKCWNKCDWNHPKIKKDAFGLAEKDSIQYVAKYIHKKYSGEMAEKEYTEKGREPVFRLLSTGIGKTYMEKNADRIKDDLYITRNGVKYSLPRYYIKKLDIPKDKLQEFSVEKSKLLVEKFTGLSDLTVDDLYRVNTKEYAKLNDDTVSRRKQHDRNLHGKEAVKTQKL